MKEYIMQIDQVLYNEETSEWCAEPKVAGELIRCKDCKHYVQLNPRQYAVRNKEGKFIGYKMVQDPPYCTEWSQEYEVNMKPDDFCSHAERTE